MTIPPTTHSLDIFTMDSEGFGRVVANVVSLPSARLGAVALRLRRCADQYPAAPRIGQLFEAAAEELERRARDEPGPQLEIAQFWPGTELRERI